jgi:hypothetical protein
MRRTVLLAILLAGTTVSGHERAHAVVALDPAQPRAGDRWRVRVTATHESALTRLGRRVTVAADMPMHAMPPLETTLVPSTGDATTYEGELTFTMPGPWRVRVHVSDAGEVMTGTFELRVRHQGLPPDTTPGRIEVELLDPVCATILRPDWVLGVSVALIVALEIAALAAARRRRLRTMVDRGSSAGTLV